MNIKSIMVGLTALAGIAALSTPASAMPVGVPASGQTSGVQKVVLVCDAWGRCWRRPNYYYGGPAYYGYGPRFYGPRFYGGWRGRRWGYGW